MRDALRCLSFPHFMTACACVCMCGSNRFSSTSFCVEQVCLLFFSFAWRCGVLTGGLAFYEKLRGWLPDERSLTKKIKKGRERDQCALQAVPLFV